MKFMPDLRSKNRRAQTMCPIDGDPRTRIASGMGFTADGPPPTPEPPHPGPPREAHCVRNTGQGVGRPIAGSVPVGSTPICFSVSVKVLIIISAVSG